MFFECNLIITLFISFEAIDRNLWTTHAWLEQVNSPLSISVLNLTYSVCAQHSSGIVLAMRADLKFNYLSHTIMP